jgi:hypothetical protein
MTRDLENLRETLETFAESAGDLAALLQTVAQAVCGEGDLCRTLKFAGYRADQLASDVADLIMGLQAEGCHGAR